MAGNCLQAIKQGKQNNELKDAEMLHEAKGKWWLRQFGDNTLWVHKYKQTYVMLNVKSVLFM